MKKKVLIVFCGGTFSMKIDEETGGAVPHYSGKELLEKIPEAENLRKFLSSSLETIRGLI